MSGAVDTSSDTQQNIQFRFGVVTALPKEFAAMRAMLDKARARPAPQHDPNDYVVGEIPVSDGSGTHQVVVTLLKKPGNNSAADAASHLIRSFPTVTDVLMVGIAGGIPNLKKPDKHVRLGDIVISNEYGVVQYDNVKLAEGKLEIRDTSQPPSAAMVGMVKFLESERLAGQRPWEAHINRARDLEASARPSPRSDRLFDADDPNKRLRHPRDPLRQRRQPKLHYGRIGSANTLLKDPKARDALREDLDLRAIEMEGSGIADGTWTSGKSYILIRGISDYCDLHKNDVWQGYAAVAAAAYARVLIESFPPKPRPPEPPDEEDTRSPKPFNRDSRHFVRDPGVDKLPLALQELEPVVDRDTEVELIKTLCQPNLLIPVLGPPSSGKSTIIRKFIGNLVRDKAFKMNAKPISLLYIDLLTKRPLRAFYYALMYSRDIPLADVDRISDMNEDDEDVTSMESKIIDIITYYLPRLLYDRSLVAVLDNCSNIGNDTSTFQELRSILNTEPFRHAVTVIETYQLDLPSFNRITVPAIEATPFTVDQAVDLLVSRGQPRQIAAAAVSHLTDESDFRLPGILAKGAERYPPILARIKGAPSSEELFWAVIEAAWVVVESVLADLGYESSSSKGRAVLNTLRAMAVMAELPASEVLIGAAGLVNLPLAELRQLGWIEGDQSFKLKGLARQGLRSGAKAILEKGGSQRRSLIDTIRSLVDARKASGLADDGFVDAIEEARLWLKRFVSGELELRSLLEADLAIVTVGDPLSPYLPEEETELLPRLDEDAERGSLDAALAGLALTTRIAGSDEGNEQFLARTRKAIDLVATTTRACLSARQLKSLDVALYCGSRRYRQFREVLKNRLAVHERLARRADIVGINDLPWVNWWISWLLNTADLHVGLGEGNKARPLLKLARHRLEELRKYRPDDVDDTWFWWLNSRLDLLEERLTTDPEERIRFLRNATERAERCLTLAPFEPRWIQFYLRSVRRLMQDMKDDTLRQAVVDQAVFVLENIFGPSEGWIADVRAQVAALIRDEARRAWNFEHQRLRAAHALSLLRRSALGESRAEISNSPRAALVEARILSFLNKLDEAEARCDEILATRPSGAAWQLKLKLADRRSQGADPLASVLDLLQTSEGTLPLGLRQSIQQFKAWLGETRPSDLASVRAFLWCTRREWAEQGSIERHAANLALRNENVEFSRLSPGERETRLRRVYKQRAATLDSLEKRFGSSIDLILAKVRNEAQYQRSLAICRRESANSNAVIKQFDKGFAIWHDNHILLFHLADYYRYIWNFADAIIAFRKVMHSTTNGDLRRHTAVHLARTLHMAGTYSYRKVIHFPDATQMNTQEMLREAKSIIENVIGHTEVANEAALLHDHILLELGENVDWDAVENLFKMLVGEVAIFPNIMIDNLDKLRSAKPDVPYKLHEVVLQDFTNPDVLGLMGMLYLRRTEMELSTDPLRDVAYAYALFNACSLLERSWYYNETILTSFRRGRSILTASRLTRSVNPFQGADTEGKRDQLTLAESKLQSTSDRTTGDFRKLVVQYQKEVQSLRHELKSD